MALMDKMKGRFSQASQNTVKMAREFSETTRLNSEISAIEGQINDLYREIGYKVYCAYRHNPLPEAAELIEQVNDLHKKIKENQAQILAINATNHCPNCGAKIKANMVFCSNCGIKLPEQIPAVETKAERPSFCPNCGEALSEEAVFCTACGTKII